MAEAIGETYAGLLEHSLKKSSLEDSQFVLKETLQTLFELMGSSNTTLQIGAAICIQKIIQTGPSLHFSSVVPYLVEQLVGMLKKKKSACGLQCLECLMGLVLYAHKEIPSHLDAILGVIIEQVCNLSPFVRKAALDTIQSLCVLCGDEMKYYKDEMIETINVVRNDQDKRVTESATEALKAVKGLDGEETDTTQARVPSGLSIPNPPTPDASTLDPPKPPKQTFGINKKRVNPNFIKAGSDDIEIFVSDKARTPTSTLPPVEPHVATPLPSPEDKNTLHMNISKIPNVPPRNRPEEESNIFKDFEDDRELRGILPRPHREDIDRKSTGPRDRDRSKTPEGDFTQQLNERSRRLLQEDASEIDHFGDRLDPPHLKAAKATDQEIKKIKKTCEGLKKENAAQAKIIDFQNKRIDSLVSHVQNMTLHINHLLGKVNQMEQNLFQISNRGPSHPQQIIVPSFNYPVGGAMPADSLHFGQNAAPVSPQYPPPQQQYPPVQSRGGDSQRRTAWDERRVNPPPQTGSIKGKRDDSTAGNRGNSHRTSERLQTNKHKGNKGKGFSAQGNTLELDKEDEESEVEDEEEEGEEEEGEDEEIEEEKPSQKRVKEINEYIQTVLHKDSRKVLDFLSDYDNLGHFSLIKDSVLKALSERLGEIISTRAESQISIALPWVEKFISTAKHKGKDNARGLLQPLKTILSLNKSSSMYSQDTLETLDRLKQAIEKLY